MHMHAILLSATAAAGFAKASSEPTLSELIASNSNLSELGKLLKKYPTVDKTIAAAGKVTVFAPDNDAIATWLNTSVGQGLATAQNGIEYILEYHVLSQVVYSSDISATPTFAQTLLKSGDQWYENVEATLEDGDVIITTGLEEQSKVIQAVSYTIAPESPAIVDHFQNLNCTSGVVHVIDKVLTIPPNVLASGLIGGLIDFTGGILKVGGLVGDALEAGPGPKTFFAPNNAAFEAIGSAADKLSRPELGDILKYHVVKGLVYSMDLKDGSVETLEGSDIHITIEDGEVFVNAARIVNANLLVGEGVLHVIDSVLNPNNATAKPDPSATVPAVQFSGASSANVAALTSTVPPASTYASAIEEIVSVPLGSPIGKSSATAMSSGATTSSMGGSGMSSSMGASTATSAPSSASSSPSTPVATGGAVMTAVPMAAMALVGGAALFCNL